jgi:hypothetical protein
MYDIMDAKIAYDKFVKRGKGWMFGLGINRGVLKKFEDRQRELNAYNSVYLGVKNVEIENVVGSVQKYMDFDKNFIPKNRIIEARWCNIYLGYMNEKQIPIVQLYKVKDEYYVYDGNHRISVARFLNFKIIEAEVTEFLPSSQAKEDVIYREKFNFEREIELQGIEFSEIYQYRRIKREIDRYQRYLEEKIGVRETYKEVAKQWHEELYLPSIKILSENNMLEYFRDRTISDLFLYFLDHKYYESEKRGMDMGYTYSIIDFVNLVKTHENKKLLNRIAVTGKSLKNFSKLRKLDRRQNMDADTLKKLCQLRKLTGIDFEEKSEILEEIASYSSQLGINDFLSVAEKWYIESYLDKKEELRKRGNRLPARYRQLVEDLVGNDKVLFEQLTNYRELFDKKYKKFSTDLVANYILDIYIPIVDFILESQVKIEKFLKIYVGIFEKYLYLFEYNMNMSIEKAAEIYFEQDGKKYRENSNWITTELEEILKKSQTIKKNLENLPKEKRQLLNDIVSAYGNPANYPTMVKIEEIYDECLEEFSDHEEVNYKIFNDLLKLYENDEANVFYKTRAALMEIVRKNKLNFLDFYVDIMEYAKYLKRDRFYVDILDVFLEYKRVFV